VIEIKKIGDSRCGVNISDRWL